MKLLLSGVADICFDFSFFPVWFSSSIGQKLACVSLDLHVGPDHAREVCTERRNRFAQSRRYDVVTLESQNQFVL